MEQIVLREEIKIPPVPIGPGEDGNGVHAFIYRGRQLDEIQRKWERTNCCLKILKNNDPFRPKLEDQWWGPGARGLGSKLEEAVHIQNIFVTYDLAPRVYAIFILEINGEKHWAMLVEDMGHWEYEAGKQNKLITGPMTTVAEKYHIQMYNNGRDHNVVAGKYVDFQGFRLPKNYEEELRQRLIGVANVGKWGPFMNYHSIPELGITGGRDLAHRIEKMELDKIDFKDKSVLDIGCSEGQFCFYATDQGARRVVGIDLPLVVKPVAELASYLGYYNADFLGYDLQAETPELGTFDIVFFLSMCQHIGFPDWISKSVSELLVFEGNGKNEDAPAIKKIRDSFNIVEEKDMTTDLLERPVLWARQPKK